MQKIDLMRELISLIKQIKHLGGGEQQHIRALKRIHAKWLRLLKESPAHQLTLSRAPIAKSHGLIGAGTINAAQFEKVKENLVIYITDHIRNPD